ncbi:MAG: hypothetical protein ACK5MZ_11515 [Aestuariibaculum sp.]
MGNIEEIVSSLEDRINKVLHKLALLKQVNKKLSAELETCKQEVLVKKRQITVLEEKCEALQITNAILGSDENKRETKLKINTLIREIDHCIEQLSS